MDLYVDDIYITTNDDDWVETFVSDVNSLAPVKNLGEIKYALGCEIEWSSDRLSVEIGVVKKIDDLLTSFDMVEVKFTQV